MKFLVSLVVLTLAIFQNIGGLKINQGEGVDSVPRGVVWTKLGGKSTLRTAALKSENTRLKSLAKSAGAGAGGIGSADGAGGVASVDDGGTDLLEQWCQKPTTMEREPIRYLICALRDAFTNSDDDNSSEDTTDSGNGGNGSDTSDSSSSNSTSGGENSSSTKDANETSTEMNGNNAGASTGGEAESAGGNESPNESSESGAGASEGSAGSGSSDDTDPRTAKLL